MKRVLFFCILFSLSHSIFPQAGHLDPTFNPTDHGYGGEASSTVHTVCLQPDGKILIGGDFTSYNGLARNRIVRLNTDGSTDLSFNIGGGPSNTVYSCAVQPDGKIIVGGNFSFYDGISRNGIVRLNSDGSLDASFDPSNGGNLFQSIYAIAIQNDGKIVIGGSFTSFGTALRRVVRLNTDGTVDPTFNPGGIGAGPAAPDTTNNVYSIVILPDGKIMISGDFVTYNGVTRNRIARLNSDGTLDTTFNSGTGAGGNNLTQFLGIKTFGIQNDGKIIIGGGFSTYNGVSRRWIARINANTSLDTTFNPGTGCSTSHSSPDRINSLLIQPDGKIIVAGNIMTYNGNTVNHIIRVNSDGSFDPAFNLGLGLSIIKKMVQQPDGKIIVVGDFTIYNGLYKNRIARINPDGSLDNTFNTATGIDGSVSATAIQNDGKIVVVGSFTSCNETPFQDIARMTADGALDTSFNAGGIGASNSTGGFNSGVYTVLIQPDQKIIIAGDFTTYNGVGRNDIARLNPDGSLDFTFTSGVGSNLFIDKSYIQPDGKIIVLGLFTTYNNIPRPGIARLNTNGGLDTTFNPVTSLNSGGAIRAFATQTDGKFILAGTFTSINGNAVNRIVRLNVDGSQDVTFNIGTGADGAISSVFILPDGKILLAGNFHSFNGTTVGNSIVRLNTDGTLDTSFYTGTGTTDFVVSNILVQPDAKIIISGAFTIFNDIPVNHIVRLNSDGALDNSFYISPIAEVSNMITTSCFQADGKIIIGGTFTSYDGIGRNRIARIFTASPPENTSTINLKLFVQGYYTGNNTMASVAYNQGSSTNTDEVETLAVELWDPVSQTLTASTQALLKTDGTAICSYPTAPNGSYYLAVKGSNFIKTWSASPVTVGPTPLTYDFTDSADKAYLANMAPLGNNVFGFHSGDINQDNSVDTADYSLWEFDGNNYAFGVYPTDLNGDGIVDFADYSFWEYNNNNYIMGYGPW